MLLAYSFIFVQCSKDDEIAPSQKDTSGQIAFSLTVVPSDVKEIQETFVTISEIKIDGKKVNGFIKQTIELSAYQEGDIKFLFNGEIEAETYNSVTLVLDYELDASGKFPGCYVLTDDNKKHRLRPSSEKESEVTLIKNFTIDPESPTEVVIDFDLRKSIIYENENNDYSYFRFVNDKELQKTFRIVLKDNCGEIKGNINKSFHLPGNMYVFVYRKGEFNRDVETREGNNNILFAKAVTSSKVKAYGSYELPLLEEGDYEIHIATYDKSIGNPFMFRGKINPSSDISGLLLNHISVSVKRQIRLNIDILGVI
jgi:hypothetical protein